MARPMLSTASSTAPGHRTNWPASLGSVIPGVVLCCAVTAAAILLAHLEALIFGRAWLESLVLAILLGTAIRSVWRPGQRWSAGIDFSAKFLLETAVLLLGASLNVIALEAAGPHLLLGIVLIVPFAIVISYLIGRRMGLQWRMALLIACGNGICGNSAIAAVAPVIGARGDDVAASIAFTAVMGVGVVIGLPFLMPVLHLNAFNFGILSGLTVYAVPQVIAATAAVSAISVNIGTLVKLIRVLMLGPVILIITLIMRLRQKRNETIGDAVTERQVPLARMKWGRILPWFIVGFLVMMGLRSANLIPQPYLAPMNGIANHLTIISMAALGLGVDIRSVSRAGRRVSMTVVASLLTLGAASVALLHLI